jgi:hypothetical protein
VQAILAQVLPAGSLVVTGTEGLRSRVSWPVLARATGIGEIQGGEMVLVPASRVADVVPHLVDLHAAGVTAVVFESPAPQAPGPSGLPVIVLTEGADVRRLQTAVERYIARKRRELFAMDQELHRVLVDPAIAGAGLGQILDTACKRAGRLVAVDRDGEVTTGSVTAHVPSVTSGSGRPVPGIPGVALGCAEPATVPNDVLLQARIAVREGGGSAVTVPGPPETLALPITTGKERRGIALLVGTSRDPDADVAILSSVSSASAIVLSRDLEDQLPSLASAIAAQPFDAAPGAALSTPRDSASPGSGEWMAAAFIDPASSSRQLARAISLELDTRGSRAVIGREGEAVVALIDRQPPHPWIVLADSIAMRLGSRTLRTGTGREHPGADGARRSAGEALEALRRSSERVASYASVELMALLQASPRWKDFARSRLGDLLMAGDGADLLRTLDAYLSAGRNAKSAARSLSVHRNTLLYRLRKIEERLRIDMDNPETLFELELALAITRAQAD